MGIKSPLNFLTNTELGVFVTEQIAEKKLLEVALTTSIGAPLIAAIIEGHGGWDKVSTEIRDLILKVVGEAERDVGAPLFQTIMQAALGVNLTDQTGQAREAVRTIERAMGFAAGLPMIVGPIAGILETKFGNHAPKELARSLRELPHEMGLSFFLGTTLASIYETATMQPLREAINVQVHPGRLELAMIVRLLKQHRIEPEVAKGYLDKAGLRPEDVDLLLQLDNVFLTPSELGEAWVTGRITDDDLKGQLDGIGYSDWEQGKLRAQWAENAQSEGANLLKQVMRQAILNNQVTEEQYSATLHSLQVPALSITLEIEALRLQKSFGAHQENVATIKALFQKGEITDAEASQRLSLQGIGPDVAKDLITIWVDESVKKRQPIGQATILRFLKTGVIKPERALQMFLDNGVSEATALLLVQSQAIIDGVVSHPLDETAYVAAFLNDVITVDDLRAGLDSLHITKARADLVIRTNVNKKNRQNKVKAPVRKLSEADIRAAVKYGTAEPSWGIRELEAIGYTEGDAQLIVTTEVTQLSGEIPAGWVALV